MLLRSGVVFLFVLATFQLGAQRQINPYQTGLKVPLSEDSTRYFRLITWHQAWLTAEESAAGEMEWTPSLRRSRLLMFAQIDKRFLILTHFGLNNLNAGNMHPVGKNNSAQVFMHDAWTDYTVFERNLHIGAGLHYWNGISRLTNQSTLNMLTLDAPRFNWPTIGTSDQFARHLGIFAKGKLGKLDYRIAFNNPLVQSLDALSGVELRQDTAVYRTREIAGGNTGRHSLQGYFQYQFLDEEANLLPYMVGSYLGTKEVFNVGAGFMTHPRGSVGLDADNDTLYHDVNLWAVDLFYDKPLGGNGAALTAYAAYYNYNFGPNYRLLNSSETVGTGAIYYGQAGYLLPTFTDKGKLQFYGSYSYRDLEALSDAPSTWALGANWYINAHNAKITAEYRNNSSSPGNNRGRFNLQAMIFL